MSRLARFLVVASASLGSLALAREASAAGLDACGDIFFEGSGSLSCQVYVDPGECKVQCEPIAFEAQCAANLKVGCDGQCNATIDTQCTSSCQGTCEADCSGGEFDCYASCEGNCTADCSAQCESAANKTECTASCKATCQAECEGGCQVDAPDCTTQCQGCCSGQCEAEANLDCQISCQAEGYASCKAELQGGCDAACDAPEGALFCDGQFVSTSNLESCVAALQEVFSVEVEYYSNAECSGNQCTAEAGGSVSCSAAPTTPGFGLGAGALGLAALGMSIARRRRARR
jgi:hypothetical protein